MGAWKRGSGEEEKRRRGEAGNPDKVGTSVYSADDTRPKAQN